MVLLWAVDHYVKINLIIHCAAATVAPSLQLQTQTNALASAPGPHEAFSISLKLTQRVRLIHLTNNWNNGLNSKIITIIRFCLL